MSPKKKLKEESKDSRVKITQKADKEKVKAAKKQAEKKANQKPPKNDKTKWYVISTQSGHEKRVEEAIKQRIEAMQLQDIISEVFVPIQKKIVIKDGKQKVKEERIFPGYVLVKMMLDKDTWEIISNTEGVSGFVRSSKYPRPLPDDEVQAILKFMEIEQPAFQASFSIGDAVKIKDGAFVDFVGSVKEIDQAKGKVKVLISIFGRETPVELELSQVVKL
ncbi:transcription termination/antitermination factor NusG [Candidatus Dojkabacteria bacterium]|nr:transcription termination/antitermination factor NusG [Candidatus Dojkabacteria bacterium]